MRAIISRGYKKVNRAAYVENFHAKIANISYQISHGFTFSTLPNQRLEEGNKLLYGEDYNDAIKLFKDTFELKPDFDLPYNNRGSAYFALKQCCVDDLEQVR